MALDLSYSLEAQEFSESIVDIYNIALMLIEIFLVESSVS